MRGRDLTEFIISVRNDSTGEVRVLHVVSDYWANAQVQALHYLFHKEGWRKATAMQPAVVAQAA